MLFFSLLLPILTQVGCNSVPVIIWGNYEGLEQTAKPKGTDTVKSSQLMELLQSLTYHRPHILLFAEENLSPEDFRRTSQSDIHFEYISNVSKESKDFLYVHAAENPVNAIHQLAKHGYSIANYDEDAPPTLANPTILAVKLREPEPDESRMSFLKSHDSAMARIYDEALRHYGKILAIYTGRHASFVTRKTQYKREVDEKDAPSGELVMSDKDGMIFIVTESPIVVQSGPNVTNLAEVAWGSKQTNKTHYYTTLDMNFKQQAISLDFVFYSPSESHTWTLEYIKIENVGVELRSRLLISAPAGFSYFCAQDVLFTGVKDGVEYSLTLKGFQAQLRVVNNMFGPAVDCVPYFSEPIWSGIMVMTLLITVAMTAILFILDIHTNDKFDDPKGKVLTISNAE